MSEVSCFTFILCLFILPYTAVIGIPVCISIKPQNTPYRNKQTLCTSNRLISYFYQPHDFIIPQHSLMHKLHSLILPVNTAHIPIAAIFFALCIYKYNVPQSRSWSSLTHTHTFKTMNIVDSPDDSESPDSSLLCLQLIKTKWSIDMKYRQQIHCLLKRDINPVSSCFHNIWARLLN